MNFAARYEKQKNHQQWKSMMFTTQICYKAMKILLIISMIFGVASKAISQESIMADIKLEKLDRLIELAIENYPQRKIMDSRESLAKSTLNGARVSYFDALNASYFYRPESKTAIDPANPYVVNGWQLGVTLNPGTLLQKPFQVKQAKKAYEIAKLETQEYRLQLTNEVKSRYYDYVLSLSELKSQTQAAQDAEALFEDARLKYERNEIERSEYSSAREAYYLTNSEFRLAEIAFLKTKDLLEQLIGVKVADIE
ncbi:MAG TPA: TolC family protein [Parapedobacter sp.]|uniref:TolC family protein n=1 Tax=Parapedobacter sp. TaxID=1958893 RepID=UPI002CF5B3A0|nr:TolC family protein [Parapedobacter sp.]HWK56115.1 TolC family protein [Parapedobacter sp.]